MDPVIFDVFGKEVSKTWIEKKSELYGSLLIKSKVDDMRMLREHLSKIQIIYDRYDFHLHMVPGTFSFGNKILRIFSLSLGLSSFNLNFYISAYDYGNVMLNVKII